jgi:preprotein translocase subunit SecG
MYTVFLVIQVLITLALVGLILVQRNDSDGLGSMGGGGGGNAFMTGRGAASLMTRSTAILATLFMLNSLWLAMMASGGNERASIADEIATGQEATTSVPLADDVEAQDLIEPEMPVTSTPKAEEGAVAPAADMTVDADAPAAPAEEAPVEATPAVPVE